MALTMDVILQNGLEIPQSYIRVENVGGGKSGAVIEVFYYLSQEKTDGFAPLERKYYNFVPSVEDNSPNFIKQGYEYLKTLPEFSQATDI